MVETALPSGTAQVLVMSTPATTDSSVTQAWPSSVTTAGSQEPSTAARARTRWRSPRRSTFPRDQAGAVRAVVGIAYPGERDLGKTEVDHLTTTANTLPA